MKRNTIGLQSLSDVRRKACAAVEAAIQNHFLLKTTSKNQFNIMKKNAKPILGGYACVRFPFFRFLTLALLMGMASSAMAQWPEWNYEANGEYIVTENKNITSVTHVQYTYELILHIQADVTITRDNGWNLLMFNVWPGGKLTIIGEPKPEGGYYKATFVGGSTIVMDDYENYPEFEGDFVSPVTNKRGMLWNNMGSAIIKHARITGFSNLDGNGDGSRGLINLVSGGDAGNIPLGILRMEDVEIDHCWAGPTAQEGNDIKLGRIISLQGGTWDATLRNVEIHHCYSNEHFNSQAGIHHFGGIIRTEGNIRGTLTLDECNIHHNKYKYWKRNGCQLIGQGGAINWRAAGSGASDTRLIITNSSFHHNQAKEGGAISTNASIEMTNVDIYDNTAVDGGGVYFWTYNGMKDEYDGRGFDAIFGNDVCLYNNTAYNYGGGIYIGIDASNDVGFAAVTSGTWNPSIHEVSPLFKVDVQTGANVYENKAPYGAGIAIRDSAPYKHYNTQQKLINGNNNPAYHQWSGEYRRQIVISGGSVHDNTAVGTTGTEVAGAGIYIEKYPTTDNVFAQDYQYENNPRQYGAGTLEVNPESGFIYNNKTMNGEIPGYGGGIYIASKFGNNIVSTLNVNIGKVGETLEICDNEAYTDGGGVYVLYDRTSADRLNQGTVTVRNGTIGKNSYVDGGNWALNGNGGGICVLGGTVHVEGGDIEYNTADQLGGGVYIDVPNDESKTTIRGGANISNNTAKGGGGVYVNKGELDVIGDFWNVEANDGNGAWELVEWSGDSYDPTEETTHTRITKNHATAGNGGGINGGDGTIDITNTLIYDNDAVGQIDKGRGGGVYLNGGTIDITTSKILYNTAQTNGGGIDDHSGDIEIYGGDISHNTATNGRGGGVYTNAGDIRIWPSALYNNPVPAPSLNDCESTGTVFSYNTAGTNGGGLNTHIGRLDVRFANVHHNEAGTTYGSNGQGPDGQGATGSGGSGGGMFCEGPHADLSGYTVRLIHTDLNDNKAYGSGGSGNDLTGRGGGLYLKYGSIFAEHCNILRNEADINGGGLDNHDGELRVYGSFVDHNKAKKGRGGGLYTDKGNLVVGPCDTYGFVNSKASRICNNTAYINGGGINNHEGNIVIHGDRINNNTAETGKGGGVYINSGNIYMYGGQINNNHADDPSGGYGGGVYGGGGTFKIMEREAHPILEILEVEDITTSGFTVHFHHVDRGYAMKPEASNKEYGIAFSENPYPSNLGENVDWTGHWDGTIVNFIPTDENPTPGEPLYIQDEGCSRFVASGLTSEKTYYVVAYGKYTYGGKNYFDASPVVTVKTHGDLPVVVTGVGFDITSTSASVNGKLFYGGSSDVTEKGIELYDGSNWTAQASNSVGDVFSVTFNGLIPNTEYKARAYAKNNGGNSIGYGDETTFTTAASGKAMENVDNTPRSTYPSVEENPFFRELTPLQQAIMASTLEGDSTDIRHEKSRDDDEPINIPQVNNNTATYGGGICIDKEGAELIFAGKRGEVDDDDPIGQINYNYASEAGGGIYIGKESADKYAQMQMMGKCEVNENHVPAGKYGGGIYLDGRLYVGDKDIDPIGTHGLKVDNNWAVDGVGAGLPTGYASNGKLNNVFLTRYEYEYNENATEAGDDKVSVITLLSDISGYADAPANTNPHSHIGFSVLKGFCPVIATSTEFGSNYNLHDYTPTGESESVSSEKWLRNLMIMSGVTSGTGTADALTGAVFEDSESYVAVHTQSDIAPFRCKFIYLWGCWTHPVVKFDPEINTGPAGNENQSMEGTGKHYKIKNPSKNVAIGENPSEADLEPLEWEIYSPEGLAWFSAYVNGLNAFDEVTGASDSDNKHHAWHKDKNPYAIAHIMNDLDMSAYLWVPIGSVKYFYINSIGSEHGGSLFVDSETDLTIEGHTYDAENHMFKGTFDGHGHIINGLQGLYLTGIKKYGLFGYLDDNAVVKNTFVDDGLFVSDDKDVTYSGGGIAGKMYGGVVSNCEARMNFNVGYSAAGTSVGGLVGELDGGSVHSSMAMPFIIGHDKGAGGSDPAYNAFDGYMGGLVGKLASGCDLRNSFSNLEVVLTPGGDGPTATRHIGGLVGNNGGIVENCYSRYQGETTPTGFGWLAGTNNEQADITYCYAPKVANEENYNYSDFVYVNVNNGALQYQENYGTTELVSGKYGFRHRDQQMTTNNGNVNIINDVFLGGLLPTLNKWVETKNTELGQQKYSTWTRTMGSPINDDYPILVFEDFNSVGSKDKIYMLYEDDINHMWNASVMEGDVVTIPGKNFQALNTPGSVAAMYLYNVQPEITPATNPATYVPVSISRNTNVPLYIHEDVGITQNAGDKLTARTGVTIRNARKGSTDQTSDPNWHLFSSSLYRTTEEGTKGVPLGIEYHTDKVEDYEKPDGYTGTYYINNIPNKDKHPQEVWEQRKYWDPPKTTWLQSEAQYFDGSSETGYFPTNTPYGTWRTEPYTHENNKNSNGDVGFFDFYEYNEFYYHWINYKREGTNNIQDHWHWDKDAGDSNGNGKGEHYRIGYTAGEKYINDTEWKSGKGYLMALSSESMMMADGLLNTDEVTIAVTNTPIGNNLPPNGHGSVNYSVPWRSLNLIGNPYQSYLDFDKFVLANVPEGSDGKGYCYAVIDDSKALDVEDRYIYYTTTQSDNPDYSGGRLIHPHQGFFVKVAADGNLKFNNTMRVAGKTGVTSSFNSPYRSQVNYPLVNLLCYDEDGRMDLTTVEVNRPEFGGGHKMEKLHESKGLIYAHLENESFQTLFTPVGTNVVPVRFIPNEDGMFTLNWNTLHGEFSYLHLIDNITGVDVDCLTNDEYKFEGKTSDYKSRFKLVFRCDGDEPEDPEEPDNPDDGEDSDHFAFMFGDELVVNGEGMLQMFDVQGRCLMETRAVGQQSSHRLPSVAAGVYVFRLTGDKKVKVQKMVIK